MTLLSESIGRASTLLQGSDLRQVTSVEDLLSETSYRRTIDLGDLNPHEQATLIAGRSNTIQPGLEQLALRIEQAHNEGRAFVAKFGIDPTGAEVHVGHAVPMQVLSRFQRMGHTVVFVVGDITAKIGDPSGRSDERPPLTDGDIAANLASYQDQVSPFFDFSKAQFRRNSEWLTGLGISDLIEVLAKIPASMPLQRQDFRTQIAGDQGLSMAGLFYSVVMALDSVAINCDLEIGGLDQFLNMQMCRTVMELRGQVPELVVVTDIIEGTGGSGTKMSKSKGNFIPIGADAGEIFGQVMSIPDRLIGSYFRSLTEWSDSELTQLRVRVVAGDLSVRDAKKILAGEICASIHGVEAAMHARSRFEDTLSDRRYVGMENLPEIGTDSQVVVDILTSLGFTQSTNQARALACQGGLRVVLEDEDGREDRPIELAEVYQPLCTVVPRGDHRQAYLKVGQKVARIPA